MMAANESTIPINSFPKDGYCAITLDGDDHVENDVHMFCGYHKHTRMVKRSDGRSHIRHVNITSDRKIAFGYLTDGFTTLVNCRWSILIFFFCALYIISWLLFGTIWTLVSFGNGRHNDSCVVNIEGFSSAFLFSIEVQMTIGFGHRYVTQDCHSGIFIILLQSLVGLMIDAFLLGLIFTKLTRPRNRRKTIVFSRIALVYEKDGQKVLEFRIADIRHSSLVECHMRVQLYWNRLVDPSNNRYEFQQFDLDVGYDTGRDRIFLLTPVSIYHYIDESSPLYGLTQSELEAIDFEIVVILEGIVEATGLTVQALWSYSRDEVEFDRRFLSMVSRRRGKWEVDYSKIDATIPIHGQRV